jgi:L-ascorbate metabolism protein UlaG (beta-lactamase superfamily)
MKITKFGHSCVLIEENGVRILTDPGKYSTLQNEINNLDVILISHSHGDHCDIKSIELILQKNPEAKIFTNSEVGLILEKENIKFELLENGQVITEKNVLIEGCGDRHIIVYNGEPAMKNLGFIINSKLFFTGDELTKLNKKIEALAFPMAGPVFSLEKVLNYIVKINPKICFPLHDAVLNEKAETYYIFSKEKLEPLGIKFVKLEIGKEFEF